MTAPERARAVGRPAPTFVSLFSGCGGLDLGLVAAGFRCILAVDDDAEALAVHSSNIGATTQRLDLSVGRPADAVLSSVDAFVCGPPCQGFSTMGGRTTRDPRNSLLLRAAKLATVYLPPLVIIENVLGALSTPHRHYWIETEDLLRSVGYRTTTIKLDMNSLGIPQTRRRLLLIAWTTGFEGGLDMSECTTAVALGDVLIDVEGRPNHDPRLLPEGSRNLEIAHRIGQGQKLCNVRRSKRCVRTWEIPTVFGPTTAQQQEVLEALVVLRRRDRTRDWGDADPVATRAISRHVGKPVAATIATLAKSGYIRRIDGLVDLAHTFNGKFKRPEWSGLSPTVDTRFGDYHYFLHPIENRGFTVREAARIQSFPDDFEFSGPLRSQFRMVGNAVPPQAAAEVARVLLRTVLT